MKMRHKQSGMSALGILAILIMVGFFAMCTIRMAPPYFEYLSVKDIIERLVLDPETKEMSIGSIRRKLDSVFNTNQIYATEAKAVEIFRKEGNVYIDASYEARVPVVWRIDGVMKFDDLKYQVGVAEPIGADLPKK